MIEDWDDRDGGLQLSIDVSEEPVMLRFQLSGWLEPLLPPSIS